MMLDLSNLYIQLNAITPRTMTAPWKRNTSSDRSLQQPEPTQKAEVSEHRKNNPHISVRDFIVYLGPTLIVSLAYVDPGNFGTDIAGGSVFNYDLIWAVWMASAF